MKHLCSYILFLLSLFSIISPIVGECVKETCTENCVADENMFLSDEDFDSCKDFDSCTNGCTCNRDACYMASCTHDCTCNGDYCYMPNCTKNCIDTKGDPAKPTDMTSCTENCDCQGGYCKTSGDLSNDNCGVPGTCGTWDLILCSSSSSYDMQACTVNCQNNAWHNRNGQGCEFPNCLSHCSSMVRFLDIPSCTSYCTHHSGCGDMPSCTEHCTEKAGGGSMSACTHDCVAEAPKVDMSACTHDCTANGGHVDMSACTENCKCPGGYCDMSSCRGASCFCNAGNCFPGAHEKIKMGLCKKYTAATLALQIALPILGVLTLVTGCFFYKKCKRKQDEKSKGEYKPTFPVSGKAQDEEE